MITPEAISARYGLPPEICPRAGGRRGIADWSDVISRWIDVSGANQALRAVLNHRPSRAFRRGIGIDENAHSGRIFYEIAFNMAARIKSTDTRVFTRAARIIVSARVPQSMAAYAQGDPVLCIVLGVAVERPRAVINVYS